MFCRSATRYNPRPNHCDSKVVFKNAVRKFQVNYRNFFPHPSMGSSNPIASLSRSSASLASSWRLHRPVAGMTHRWVQSDRCELEMVLVLSTHCGEKSMSFAAIKEHMKITGIVPQLRTTDLASSIRFYTEKLGFTVEFNYQDFYTGIRAGSQIFHLKLVDEIDPSIPYASEGEPFHLYLETNGISDVAAELKARGVKLVKDVHTTPWNTREIVIHDDQGHTLDLGEPL
jgi:catechol 2,3-dioxygenase-like lactoylglutathione lyase family enzyme